MKKTLIIAFLLIVLPGCWVQARESIVLYRTGMCDPAMANGLRKYLLARGFGVSVYEGADTIEKQIQNANKINKEKAALLLVVELIPSDNRTAMFAISDAKKPKGLIVQIDEVPGVHISRSEELAAALAEPYGKKVKRLPLFALLGIDMPGLFIGLDWPRDKMGEAFDKLYEGIQNYLKRGVQNEIERQSE